MTVTSQGAALAETIRARRDEIRDLVSTIDDAAAARPPTDGGWSANQVLAHLAGPPQQPLSAAVREAAAGASVTLGLRIGAPYFEGRETLTRAQLCDAACAELESLAAAVEGLSDDQLARTISAPGFAETPLTATPTVGQFVGAVADLHCADHIGQLKALGS